MAILIVCGKLRRLTNQTVSSIIDQFNIQKGILTNGPQIAGPMANPSTKTVTPTMKTSVLMLKSSVISLAETEYAEDVKVTAKTDKVAIAVMNHFRNSDQFMGFIGSSFWNSTTKGSSSVPLPPYM